MPNESPGPAGKGRIQPSQTLLENFQIKSCINQGPPFSLITS
jgi:hypothetical protein